MSLLDRLLDALRGPTLKETKLPNINKLFQGDVWQDFGLTSPFDGVAHITNNALTNSIYIRQTSPPVTDGSGDIKIRAGETADITLVKGGTYSVEVTGDVSITYSLDRA